MTKHVWRADSVADYVVAGEFVVVHHRDGGAPLYLDRELVAMAHGLSRAEAKRHAEEALEAEAKGLEQQSLALDRWTLFAFGGVLLAVMVLAVVLG